MTVTEQQIKNAIEIASVVAAAIKDLRQVPSGELYAQLMGHLTLEQYNGVIRTLLRTRLIRQENHLIIWVGGE